MELEDLAEEGEDDRDIVPVLLKNRETADLERERQSLEEILERLSDLAGPSSKTTKHLEVLEKDRRISSTGRYKQTVIFNRFYDILVDIVRRLKKQDPKILLGTYSGKKCRFVEVGTWKLKSTELEDIKHRFLKGGIDVLVYTDAAAEGLYYLQTDDMIVNFELGWNPMKIEQSIGRIDRIGQRHDRIFVLNLLCYFGSAEEIVYGRLLHRLAEADSVVGEQQFSMAPVYKEEFLDLAEGRLTEKDLEEKIREKYAAAGNRTRSR